MTSITLRAACDRATGSGHLRRCLTLARELLTRGADVTVVSDDDPVAQGLLDSVVDVPYQLVAPDTPLDVLEPSAVTVIDLPAAPRDSERDRALRREIAELDRRGSAVISLGHSVTETGHLRAVIDLYPSQQLSAVNYVEGPAYLILRPEFAAAGPVRWKAPSEVLVAMGGTDPFDLTGTALRILGEAEFDGVVHVLLGSGHGASPSEVQAVAEGSGLDARVHQELAAPDLINLMSGVGAGIVAFGTTAYELMCLGIPVLGFAHYRWQVPSARYFAALGALDYLGCAEEGLHLETVGHHLADALADEPRLKRRVARGPEVVDGRGVARVADLAEGFAVESGNRELDSLYVLAHPGDEVFGCGATILRQTRSGERVGIVILGEGTAGRHEGTEEPQEMHASRVGITSALQDVTDFLGVAALYYYRHADNRFDAHDLLDLARTVEFVIARHRPQTVFTHHPGDLNIDHRRTFEAVATATRPDGITPVRRLLSVEVPSSSDWGATLGRGVFTPNVFVDIGETLDEKLALAARYTSEIRSSPHPRSLDGLRVRATHWGHLSGSEAAEAFVLHRQLGSQP